MRTAGSSLRGWLAIGLATMLVLGACGPGATPAPTAPPGGAGQAAPPAPGTAAAPSASGAPRKGGVLRVSTLGGAPKVLHPYPEPQHNTTPRRDAEMLIWSRLIELDWEKLDFVADPRYTLARELPKITNNGRTLTFTLRDDIKWSDGKPITSEDFQFAWENASKKENNYVGLADLERIESFKTPDPKTIEITLKETLARSLALELAGEFLPVPRHVWQGKPWLDPGGNPEIVKPTVVSGPFMPKELTAERHSYVRNPQFWGRQPTLDEIVFVNASPQTVVELLTTRQVEWAQSVPPAQFEDLKRQPNVTTHEWVGATGSYRVVIFNLRRPQLADKRVREALARAINRDDLVQFEDNLAVPQFGLNTEGNRFKSDDVEKYAFDLNRSKQLLQEAGYRLEGGALKGTDGQPFRLEILWPTTSAPRGKMATYLQQQWKQLGVEAQVTGLEFNAFTDKYQRQRDFDVAMGSWAAELDPDGVKSQIITNGSQNASGYSNPRVDELVKQGAAEQDEARRKQIYDEIQKIVVGDLPQYQMLTLKNTTAFDKKVGGVTPLKGGDILRQNNLQVLDWHFVP